MAFLRFLEGLRTPVGDALFSFGALTKKRVIISCPSALSEPFSISF